jgi:hypothetical protein
VGWQSSSAGPNGVEYALNFGYDWKSATSGWSGEPAWYKQAWNAYWDKFHETAVVFNMDDDPNAEGWNSAPMGGHLGSIITVGH